MSISSGIQRINSEIQDSDRQIRSQQQHQAGLMVVRGCLQGLCSHTWKFQKQWNAYHEHFWIVQYPCTECDAERKERKIPVCEVCDCAVVRCGPEDVKAEEERCKPEHQGFMNRPLAFRCPQCRKIHILRHQGD